MRGVYHGPMVTLLLKRHGSGGCLTVSQTSKDMAKDMFCFIDLLGTEQNSLGHWR